MSGDETPPMLVDAQGPAAQKTHPVPVTILTGFLGSGKTTLLRHLLANPQGRRIAVVMNEVGDTAGFDAVAARDAPGVAVADWVELANGCMCCSVKGEAAVALEALAKRTASLDAIVVETTGIADPASLVSMLWLDDELQAAVRLDGVVTVVDCMHIGARAAESPVAQRQLALADRVILNKTDLVAADELDRVAALVADCAPFAQICRTDHGRVDPSFVLGVDAYADRVPSLPATAGTHGHGFSTASLSLPERLSPTKGRQALESWLRDLLWERRFTVGSKEPVPEVLRLKGIVRFGEEPPEMVQGVERLFELQPVTSRLAIPGNMLVLIGPGVRKAAASLQAALDAYLAL